MEEELRRPCPKCIAGKTDPAVYFADLSEYIANMDRDVKADDSVREQRLALCRACKMQISGMCRACGCFVELRTAVKSNACPYEKWRSL